MAEERRWVRVQTRRVGAEVTAENFEVVMRKWAEHPETGLWRGITKMTATTENDVMRRHIEVNEFVMPRRFAGEPSGFVDDTVDLRTPRSRVVFTPTIDFGLRPLRMSLPKFYPKAESFAFTWAEGEIAMEVLGLRDETSDGDRTMLSFVGEKLLAKLDAWGKVGKKYKKQSHHDLVVPRDRFVAVSRRVKREQSKWTEKWQHRKLTGKYVHEDIGIASYLICLMEEERRETGIPQSEQTFVDLGCGNGLLVHILASEGYKGFGIDLNERSVWSMYDRSVVDLRAMPFDPTSASFPGVRWFIGNHADELTPWVPVIAARSGFGSRFLNIPCCFWSWDSRFSDSDPRVGKYKTFLAWLATVSRTCGFDAEIDWMRIPSTKNVCHVGRRRNFPEGECERVLRDIDAMLAGIKPFKPREWSAPKSHHEGISSSQADESDSDGDEHEGVEEQ